MLLGICAKVERAAELRAAGADFVEENVQALLQGLTDDAKWHGMEKVNGSVLPVFAANSLVPSDLKIVGESVDFGRLQWYIGNIASRARRAGIKVLVFGSGGARNVPEGFDRRRAHGQIVTFCKMAADLCASAGITLVAEPLNRKECNVINSVAEAMEYVKAVNHRNFQCLVDSYHFWMEGEPLQNLTAAMPWIRHVHVADKDGRVAPGESGTADYRPFFHVLKQANYQGAISVEALGFDDFQTMGKRVISFLRRQWEEA
ncbi:MAG TPA: sugar phosphate isomerase/epimerase family protein [Tepidisphaeraceae bacterium]|jgi:sugar phosphate isomerase/epimerase|nr:sugar phosphate isomerase/epimerase family protein [Tepidisphaeraceae bacterium]